MRGSALPGFLTRLREAPCAVTGLAEAIGMEQSAVSHQLRLLRNLGCTAAGSLIPILASFGA
jgi:DNA-binding IclR family transcriptional regulator